MSLGMKTGSLSKHYHSLISFARGIKADRINM